MYYPSVGGMLVLEWGSSCYIVNVHHSLKKTFLLLDIKQTNEAYGYKEHGTSTEVVKFITPGSLVWFWYKG